MRVNTTNEFWWPTDARWRGKKKVEINKTRVAVGNTLFSGKMRGRGENETFQMRPNRGGKAMQMRVPGKRMWVFRPECRAEQPVWSYGYRSPRRNKWKRKIGKFYLQHSVMITVYRTRYLYRNRHVRRFIV